MPALFQLNRELKHTTLQQQIRVQLVDAILGGYIPLDESLPSSRGLAKSLNVARNTIVLVYDELAADGYLISKERCGYYVDPKFTLRKLSPLKRPKRSTSSNSDQNVERIKNDSKVFSWFEKIKTNIKTVTNSSLSKTWQEHPFPFVYSQIDTSLFPIENWRKCWRDTVSIQAVKDWAGDKHTSDDLLLIEQIRKRILPNRSIQADANEILITVGSQQAIYLLGQLLLNPQSNFGIEDPGYMSTANIADLFGADIIPLKIGSKGPVINKQLSSCD